MNVHRSSNRPTVRPHRRHTNAKFRVICECMVRFIKSTFSAMFTITGITSIVIKFIVSFKKGQWWKKKIYSYPLKVIFDASLCILCSAFLQKLHCARVSHGMVQFVLKMAQLSILMEPTLLLGKGSATVSYNPFGWCWYLNVAYMLAAYSYGIVCIRGWTSLVF